MDDFTESFAYLSPEKYPRSIPRAPASVERTQNLLDLAEKYDSSAPHLPTSVAARPHNFKRTPSTPRAMPVSGYTAPVPRLLGFALEFLGQSTPFLNVQRNASLGAVGTDAGGKTARRTVGASVILSSGTGDGGSALAPGVSGGPVDSVESHLNDIVRSVPLSLMDRFVARMEKAAFDLARGAAAEHALDTLDLDLTQDHTFDQRRARADSVGTTPPGSSGNNSLGSAVHKSVSGVSFRPVSAEEEDETMCGDCSDGGEEGEHGAGEAGEPRDATDGGNVADDGDAGDSTDTKESESRETLAALGLRLDAVEAALRVQVEAREGVRTSHEERIKALEDRVEVLAKHHNALQQQLSALVPVVPLSPQSPTPPPIAEKICVAAPITEHTLDSRRRQQYRRLQLDLVDVVLEAEARNLLKCLMLTLGFLDFEHLPEKSAQLAAFMKLLCRFMNTLHRELYGCTDIMPLDYLYKPSLDVQSGLEDCLAGMTSLLSERAALLG